MSKTMRIVAGLDIGNGYVKGVGGRPGAAKNELMSIDMPSVVSYTTGANMIPKEPSDAYIANLANELDVSVSTNAIPAKDGMRMFFGQRAIRSGEALYEFNIADAGVPKCEESLSTILVLGTVATLAVRAYWAKHHELPGDLDVEACVGITLPIEDFMKFRDVYPTTLKGDSHMVTIYNFEHAIHVRVAFADVTAVAEGAAAQYAITELGPKFLQNALDIARAQGAKIDPGYTGEVLASVENTIGVDVGEGTVNFPVYSDGVVNIEASRSINRGYGTVLTRVVGDVRNDPSLSFKSRKDLADFMLDTSQTPSKRVRREKLQHYIDDAVNVFVREVMSEFSNIFSKVGTRTDAVYVYGGGANGVRDALYPELVNKVTYDGDQSIPVIYLDSSYSRNLNREGLFRVAQVKAGNVWAEPRK